MLLCYIICQKCFFVEKEERKFGNLPEPVLKQTNASTLHEAAILLKCKESIPSIIKTLKIIVTPRDLYGKFLSIFMMNNMLNPLPKSFNFLSKTSWQNLISRAHHWMESLHGRICLSRTAIKRSCSSIIKEEFNQSLLYIGALARNH